MTPSHGEGKQGHGLSLPCPVLEGKDAGAGVTLFLCSVIRCVVTHTSRACGNHATAPPSGEAENCWALSSGQTLAERHCVGCRAQLPVCMHSGIDTVERRN